MSSDADKNATETAKYATIVNAPTANKVKDADLTLDWVDGKDYYTLRVDNGKASLQKVTTKYALS